MSHALVLERSYTMPRSRTSQLPQSRRSTVHRGAAVMPDPSVPTGGILLETSIEVFKPVARSAGAWVASEIWGKKILIIGPGGSGKTHLLNFLRFGTLAAAQALSRSSTDEVHSRFKFSGPRNTELHFAVKSMCAAVGQSDSNNHVRDIQAQRPDILIVVLSCGDTDKAASLQWFENFCKAVSTNDKAARKAIRRIEDFIVLANKADLTKSTKQFCKAVKEHASTVRETCFQIPPKDYLTISSILIAHPKASEKAHVLVNSIAERLRQRKSKK